MNYISEPGDLTRNDELGIHVHTHYSHNITSRPWQYRELQPRGPGIHYLQFYTVSHTFQILLLLCFPKKKKYNIKINYNISQQVNKKESLESLRCKVVYYV